jgi:hypothetical protein
MPSSRTRDKGKLVRLSPTTANGRISILKVICAAMTKHYELARDPALLLRTPCSKMLG